MTKTIICQIPKETSSYEIEIAQGLLQDKRKIIQAIEKLDSRIAIIADDAVAPLYGLQLESLLRSAALDAHLFSFPKGELNKTRAAKEQLEDQLLGKGYGRDTCIIAMGGGVSTDLAGYLAATYCRGVPLIMMPTSLLGMVDASIGGKTGVNLPAGKNLVGAIYQPKKVMIDPMTLRTLPMREFRNGIVEIIKHALIGNRQLFHDLEIHSEKFLELDAAVLEKMIFESCKIKKNIVELDERETGMRRLLNFGHTIGHALEHLTDYALAHGEAVAIGILVESYLSLQLGYLSESSFNEIRLLFHKYAIPTSMDRAIPIPAMLEALAFDKKSLKGMAHFALIKEIGTPLNLDSSYCMPVEERVLVKALHWMNDKMHGH